MAQITLAPLPHGLVRTESDDKTFWFESIPGYYNSQQLVEQPFERRLYKRLVKGGIPPLGEKAYVWSLPTQNPDGTWTPGDWMTQPGQIVACRNGLHAFDGDQVRNWMGRNNGDQKTETLYVLEYDGPFSNIGDKYVGGRARLLRPIDYDREWLDSYFVLRRWDDNEARFIDRKSQKITSELWAEFRYEYRLAHIKTQRGKLGPLYKRAVAAFEMKDGSQAQYNFMDLVLKAISGTKGAIKGERAYLRLMNDDTTGKKTVTPPELVERLARLNELYNTLRGYEPHFITAPWTWTAEQEKVHHKVLKHISKWWSEYKVRAAKEAAEAEATAKAEWDAQDHTTFDSYVDGLLGGKTPRKRRGK